jgi:hypothetical protein
LLASLDYYIKEEVVDPVCVEGKQKGEDYRCPRQGQDDGVVLLLMELKVCCYFAVAAFECSLLFKGREGKERRWACE